MAGVKSEVFKVDITYKIMDYFIRRGVLLSKNIAICPMGEYGLKAKQILNWRYGIEERFRIDNNMKAFSDNIIGLDDLEKEDVENLVIILATANKKVSCELMDQIHKMKKDIKVINILDPIVFEEYIKTVRDLLTIRKVAGQKNLVRVGREYDGGYIMLDDFANNMHAYSFGIADDVSWEEDISEKGMKVFMYDHTIEDLPKQVKGGVFHKIGISGKDDLDNHLLSMETILDRNDDVEKDQLILKMDVEGAEWDFLRETSSDILECFAQMTFEFHSVLDLAKQKQIVDVLSKLNKTHQVIWVHANNCSHAYTADGLVLPNLLEATYVNKKKYRFSDYDKYILPMELDMPNLSDRNDILLGDFGGFNK